MTRLALLHGFTQTHHHWYRPVEHLDAALSSRQLDAAFTFVDMPGHGLGDPPRDFAADASRLAELVGPAVLVGYSMGGRLALAAALERPSDVEALVLVGATAGLVDDGARERRSIDERRARQIEREGVEAFVDDWLAAPMFAGLTHPGRAHRLRNTAAGLAASLRRHGTGSQPNLWPQLDRVSAPTLVVAGERDAKFTSIGERLSTAIPNATLAIVAGAGHACHSEQPAAFSDVVADWLAALDLGLGAEPIGERLS